jgi:hypothetical protein
MDLTDDYKEHIEFASFYLILPDEDHDSILLLAKNLIQKLFSTIPQVVLIIIIKRPTSFF